MNSIELCMRGLQSCHSCTDFGCGDNTNPYRPQEAPEAVIFTDEQIQHFVDVLNRALRADPLAVELVVDHRVRCNDALLNDPTVLVAAEDQTLSPIGLINGLIGGGASHIAAVFDIDEDGFETLIRFERV